MEKEIKNLQRQIFILYALIAAILVAAFLMSDIKFASFESFTNKRTPDSEQVNKIATDLFFATCAMKSSCEKFIYTETDKDKKNAEKNIAVIRRFLSDSTLIMQLGDSPARTALFRNLGNLTERYISTFTNLSIRLAAHRNHKKTIIDHGKKIEEDLYKQVLQSTQPFEKEGGAYPIGLRVHRRFMLAATEINSFMSSHKQEHYNNAFSILEEIVKQTMDHKELIELMFDIEDYMAEIEAYSLITSKIQGELAMSVMPLGASVVEVANNLVKIKSH